MEQQRAPHSVPMFTALLARHDLTVMHVLTYGAVAALQAEGYEPSYRDVAVLVGDQHPVHNPTRERMRDLVRAGLVRRLAPQKASARTPGETKRARTRFVLSGPVTNPMGNNALPVACAS